MVFTSTLNGPENEPAAVYKDSVSLYLWHRLDTFAEKTLFVDFDSEREWSGAKIKQVASRATNYLIANNLIQAQGGARSVCLTLYPNCDHVYLITLATLFAGCATCAADCDDPRDELEHLINIIKPKLVCAGKRLVPTLVWLMQQTGHKFNVCIMDDAGDVDDAVIADCTRAIADHTSDAKVIGFNKHLLNEGKEEEEEEELVCCAQQQVLPLSTVSADEPAFLLLTSGSTGRPKPVIRSQRNALYDCHLFRGDSGRLLWHLDSQSVMAAHLPLDHGTGTFNFLISIGEGVKVILMKSYDFEQMCSAIKRYKISDCMLGSALMHNFIESPRWQLDGKPATDLLSSLRNFIAIGSPIVSYSSAAKFMRMLNSNRNNSDQRLSIRQAFGMTECGFVSVVERERSFHYDVDGDDSRELQKSPAPVGKLLPGMRLRLLELDAGSNNESRAEIDAYDTVGELYLSAPTVSPGYWGDAFVEQSRATFIRDSMNNGQVYYRSHDLAKLTSGSQELVILGRVTDVLCLYDGWKVLPHEIELVVQLHPKVLEAAVVGVPHPNYPGQHAPRAYVVPRAEHRTGSSAELVEELKEFVRERVSPPKRLDGGVKLLDELPRISIGKVDKRALLRADGY